MKQSLSQIDLCETLREVLMLSEPSADYVSEHLSGVESMRVDQLIELLSEARGRDKEAMERERFDSSSLAGNYLLQQLYGKSQEEFWVLLLDHHCRLISARMLFRGTSEAAAISPAVIFRTALEAGARKIILCHNHPSGCVEPSEQDIMSTESIIEAGKLLDIAVLDHFIIGGERYLSMKEFRYI